MSRRVLARCERARHVLAADDGLDVYGSPAVSLAGPAGLSVKGGQTYVDGALVLRAVESLQPGDSEEVPCPSCGVYFLLEHAALLDVYAAPRARPLVARRVT